MPLKIQKNIPLAKYTTFKVGGPAKYFCVVKNMNEVKKAFEFAENGKLKVFILGGGSNLLVSDRGFDGLAIKLENGRLKVESRNSKSKIICEAGVPLAKLVLESVGAGLNGMEWAVGIPGTVGGAICNNTGAFGKSMSDVVDKVEVLEIAQKSSTVMRRELWSQRIFTNKQCDFSYRDSIFKKEKRYIIFNIVLKLKKGNQKESRKTTSEYLKIRTKKQPLGYSSAGSVFKNPAIDNKHFEKLIKNYPGLKSVAKNKTIPAGWLIETLELKSKKIGRAMISEKHGNFIVNIGDAKAEDVIILISLIKQKVRDNFGIQLNEEIEYVGF